MHRADPGVTTLQMACAHAIGKQNCDETNPLQNLYRHMPPEGEASASRTCAVSVGDAWPATVGLKSSHMNPPAHGQRVEGS